MADALLLFMVELYEKKYREMEVKAMEELNYTEINKELLHFLDESPNAFYAVKNMSDAFDAHGFTRLNEGEVWKLEAGGNYYVSRNDSALIAFRIPKDGYVGYQIMASHADSPVFKIKTNAEIEVDNAMIKLNVEKYGGMICAPWLDRPLSIAGRVVIDTDKGIETRLINIDKDLLIIPNLAIHMNHDVNNGYSFNAQKDMLPLFGDIDAKGGLLRIIAEAAGTKESAILDTDLYLYNRNKGTVFGANNEYIASGRLDDLQSAFSSMKALLLSEPKRSIALHCVYDNEEVGSVSKQGAASSFLKDVMGRINSAFGKSDEEKLILLQNSFLISADNAHCVHPNQSDKADPTNRPYMNKGIVIKYSANQKYTTDAISGALFRKICKKAGVPYQTFANRSDMIGGSTLGNISTSQLAVNTIDIGLPQLAMHSCYETAGAKDTAYFVKTAQVFYSSSVEGIGNGSYSLS